MALMRRAPEPGRLFGRAFFYPGAPATAGENRIGEKALLQLIQNLFSAIMQSSNVSALKNLDVIDRARILAACAAVVCIAYVILQSLGVFPKTWWPN